MFNEVVNEIVMCPMKGRTSAEKCGFRGSLTEGSKAMEAQCCVLAVYASCISQYTYMLHPDLGPRSSLRGPWLNWLLLSLDDLSYLPGSFCACPVAQLLADRPKDHLVEIQNITRFCLIRNQFISNLVLDNLKFKKLLELQRKS